MKILLLGLLFCFALLGSACASRSFIWHDLEFKNLSDIKVEFKTRGIQLYSLGRGPQDLGGFLHPGRLSSYATYGPLRLSYPVEVSWRSGEGKTEWETKEYKRIPGIPEGQKIVKVGGFLIVGLSPDFELRIFFIEGEQRPYELADQIIRGEAPLPE